MKCGNRSTFVLLAAGFALAGIAKPAVSQTVVLPNSNTSTSGASAQLFPFANYAATFQWEFAASQLAGVPIGTQITSIGFRLPAGSASQPTAALSYAFWNLQLSTPQQAFPNLSATFASNIGADAVTVLSGPLAFAPNAFTGGAGPNPFLDLAFTTPYTYTGGDILFTLHHSTSANGNQFLVDANAVADGNGNTVGAQNDSAATSGTVGFFNYPITLLDYHTASVPEPGTVAFLVAFLVPGAALGIRRLRRS